MNTSPIISVFLYLKWQIKSLSYSLSQFLESVAYFHWWIKVNRIRTCFLYSGPIIFRPNIDILYYSAMTVHIQLMNIKSKIEIFLLWILRVEKWRHRCVTFHRMHLHHTHVCFFKCIFLFPFWNVMWTSAHYHHPWPTQLREVTCCAPSASPTALVSKRSHFWIIYCVQIKILGSACIIYSPILGQILLTVGEIVRMCPLEK